MDHVIFGKTGMNVSRTGFGALPIQRVSFDEAGALLRRAYEAGVNFFDTARAYSDSEEKIGRALADVRNDIILLSKSPSKTAEGYNKDLETTLSKLKTDYVDVYQFHNAPFVPVPGGADGLYDAALAAKKAGKIRFIGITEHSLERAFEAVETGLYDTLQYPFSHLATEREIELVRLCAEKGVGFICMKGMSGGLVNNAKLPFAFIRQFDIAVPIWGVQRMSELDEFIEYSENPPELTNELLAEIEADKKELSGAFCRSCGYCMPCPVGIPIPNANRIEQLLTRSPYKNWITPEWRSAMDKVEDCVKCGLCAKKCPYGLKPFETLPKQLAFYRKFCEEHKSEL